MRWVRVSWRSQPVELSPWNKWNKTEIMEMRRQYLIWMLLVLIVPSAGCQSCLTRWRGARCRPSFTLPSLRGARPQAEAPCADPCTTSATGFAPAVDAYAPYVQPGSVHVTEGVPIDGSSGGIISGPIEQPYTTNRPIVSGTIISSSPVPADGNVMTVPGPELGPVPSN